MVLFADKRNGGGVHSPRIRHDTVFLISAFGFALLLQKGVFRLAVMDTSVMVAAPQYGIQDIHDIGLHPDQYVPPVSTPSLSTTRYSNRTKQRLLPNRIPDGTFNGGPVYLQKNKPLRELSSHVHCVGENYQIDSWKERSCHFQFLRLNTSSHDYVLFQSDREYQLGQHVQQRNFIHVSDMMHRLQKTNSVSIGGINIPWANQIRRLEWFPKIVPVAATSNNMEKKISYYELPPATIMIPFHSLSAKNPGHLVFDDFLPMFTLMEMFQLHDDQQYDVLPIRYKLQDGKKPGLWASCDWKPALAEICNKMMAKFFPLMAGLDSPYNVLSTNEDAKLIVENNSTNGQSAAANLVCARNGLAGMGSLTDHGYHKKHGWEEEDYKRLHNHGRGGNLYEFRNYMLRHLQLDTTSPLSKHSRQKPYRIVFSEKSSDLGTRSLDFKRQIELVQKHFSPNDVVVENYIFKELSLQQQAQIVSNAAIYVTLCGGGAVTGLFLPKGASLILFYAEKGGWKNNKFTSKPAMLDWDLWNSASHLRVSWLPKDTRATAIDEEAFVMLIRHELALIEGRVFEG